MIFWFQGPDEEVIRNGKDKGTNVNVMDTYEITVSDFDTSRSKFYL